MKIRNFVLLTAVLAICVTSLNFLTDSFSISARLPDTGGQHHLEAARREAAGRGAGNFRLERRPRLERGLSDQGPPLRDAERTRLLGRYQQPQQLTPPVQTKQQAPVLPSPDPLQSPPPPSSPMRTTPTTTAQVLVSPPPPEPQVSGAKTQASVLTSQPPPPLVQQQPVAPPTPPAAPVTPQQVSAEAAQQNSSSSLAESKQAADSLAQTLASEGSGTAQTPPPPAPPHPLDLQLPAATSAANASLGGDPGGSSQGGEAKQAPPLQPSDTALAAAAVEVAQGLVQAVGQGINSTQGLVQAVGQGVNSTQTTLAATGALGGLVGNEAVSVSEPGNSSMAKGAAKALGDAAAQQGGAQSQAAGDGQAGAGSAVQLSPPTGKAVNRQRYHVVASVNGNVYTAWQARVCYYWYNKAREQDTAGVMGGFTRLLHSGVPDELMDDIPTVVVNPLPEGIDKGYVVLNRPYAFQQWAHQYLATLEEDYVLMAEPDHIFLKPLPLWATPQKAAAYPFFYIEPGKNKAVIQPYVKNGFPVEQMAPIGNSPVMLHKDNLSSVVDSWYNLSLSMKQDPAAEKAFGWILEMYAFTIAASQQPGGPLTFGLHPDMMIQPPWDSTLQVKGNNTFILHFTYGNDYNEQGVLTYATKTHWRFDKRDYSWHYPPLNLPAPPDNVASPSLRKLIACINEVSAATPSWAAAANAQEQ